MTSGAKKEKARKKKRAEKLLEEEKARQAPVSIPTPIVTPATSIHAVPIPTLLPTLSPSIPKPSVVDNSDPEPYDWYPPANIPMCIDTYCDSFRAAASWRGPAHYPEHIRAYLYDTPTDTSFYDTPELAPIHTAPAATSVLALHDFSALCTESHHPWRTIRRRNAYFHNAVSSGRSRNRSQRGQLSPRPVQTSSAFTRISLSPFLPLSPAPANSVPQLDLRHPRRVLTTTTSAPASLRSKFSLGLRHLQPQRPRTPQHISTPRLSDSRIIRLRDAEPSLSFDMAHHNHASEDDNADIEPSSKRRRRRRNVIHDVLEQRNKEDTERLKDARARADQQHNEMLQVQNATIGVLEGSPGK
ncbi:hypothetical protein B0H13DRAFT_2301085 [Mycena leptocephala]|nr:hypothetical protein B0H13DRAFT_2301085 [Mycena leptocephala]